MNLEESFLAFMNEVNAQQPYDFSASQVASLVDLTLLDGVTTDEALAALGEQAKLYSVAAICIFPQHLKLITPPSSVKMATVVNFPEGTQSTATVLTTIEQILAGCQIDEIDYVFPYQAYLTGEKDYALAQCQQAYQLCQQQGILFKVILESGALPSLDGIYQLSREVINQGCDFLKTSTGKINQGATPAAAFAMLQAIKASQVNCGLKISGGIKKPEQAFLYITMAQQLLNRAIDKSWFRIGASSLLNEL